MSSLNVLVQSDYFVQLIVLSSVILMGLLSYVFYSKTDEEVLKVQTKETKKQKVEKAKKAEVKDKKKTKGTTIPAVLPVSVPETKKESEKSVVPAKKVEPVKAVTPKPTPKAAKNKSSKVEEVKPVVVEAVVPEEDGWTTVTDKKQKKSSAVAESIKTTKPVTVVAEPVKITKSAAVVAEKKAVEVVEVAQNKDDDSWTTVADKRQKKTSETKSESVSPVAESKKSKKVKKMAEIEATAVKASVVVEKVQVEEVKPVVVEDESEWKTANPKISKKKSKAAQSAESSAVKPVEVKKAEAPVAKKVDAPVNVQAVPEVVSNLPKTEKSKKSKPTQGETAKIPQAIQELITAQLTTPNSIAAAIIEQFKSEQKSDSNNNVVTDQVVTKKVESEVKKVAQDVKKVVQEVKKAAQDVKKVVQEVKKIDKVTKSQVLKTTNLTESMVLVDSDGKSNSRTDSNPSSSESLQDLDVGEGWATITSKKKRTVRREF